MSLALIFSGQGLQHTRHVDELLAYCDQYPIETALRQVIPQLFETATHSLDLYDNTFAQPFILALQWCRWQMIKNLDLDVSFLCGYSLGELSALVCSTDTQIEQGVLLAHQRAVLMSKATTTASGLSSVKGLNIEDLKGILRQTQTELSIKLTDSSFIVGGENHGLDQCEQLARNMGAQSKRLSVMIPSHTRFMESAVEPYQAYINAHVQAPLNIPLISGIAGSRLYQTQTAIASLVHQMDHAIEWDLCSAALVETMPKVILEVGPGNTLSKMLNEQAPNQAIRAVDDFKTLHGLGQWLEQRIAH